MKILSIDASGNDCSVAIFANEKFYTHAIEAPRRQGELILPMVEEGLRVMGIEGQDVDGIAFGHGPGSFTGVRLTASVAQGLAVGWNKPLLPLSNLAALAYKKYKNFAIEAPIFVAIDARKQEVYAGEYQFTERGMKITYPERVVAPEGLPVADVVLSLPPTALDMLEFARYQIKYESKWVFPDQIDLVYLRNKVTD